jgi:hypothetical protein
MKFTFKKIERILLFVGAVVLAAGGLFWNLYTDLNFKDLSLPVSSVSGLLFIGLLTSIVGAVLIFVGYTINNFDVKIPGLVLIGAGVVLGLANLIWLFVGGIYRTYCIVSIICDVIGIGACGTGFAFQIVRLVKNEE